MCVCVCVCVCRAAQGTGDDGVQGAEPQAGHECVEQRDRSGETLRESGPSWSSITVVSCSVHASFIVE